MRWRTRQEGDERMVVRFAWYPVRLSSGETIWLERYVSKERLVRDFGEFGGSTLRWARVRAGGIHVRPVQ